MNIPTPSDVAKRREHNLAPQIKRLTHRVVDALNGTLNYPVTVPVIGEHHYDVDAIAQVVAAVAARGWAVEYRPGDNMLTIAPAAD